jgi:hypothetical protein
MSGHVFVMRGDMMSLACDAWLLPGGYGPGSTWARAIADHDPSYPEDWGQWNGPRVMPWPALSVGPTVPEPFLTYVVGTNRDGAGWFADGARAFVRFASARVKVRPPYHGRARHLLAVPLVGTGMGGAWRFAGDVLQKLLPALREEAAAHEVDVALVLYDGPAFAAAEAERLLDDDVSFAALTPAERAAADALGDKARAGDLVVFIGAGVSQGAGLPSWNMLLADLAGSRARIEERDAFARLGELDRAAILSRRLAHGERLGAVVAEHLLDRSTHYALCHGLLASLPVDEVITTNYDDLFERASAAVGRPVTVLPGGEALRGERWLLKMHGCVSRPESIVLTREDYLRYQENRSALAGIVEALLITRHMLFAGFSFSDDNFHRIAHAVRQAVSHRSEREGGARFGTTLVVNPNPLARELWQDDIEWLAFDQDPAGGGPRPIPDQIRRVEIFLDRVAARAATTTSHLCDRRYEAVLSPAERKLKKNLEAFVASAGDDIRATPAWREVARLLKRLGAREA